MSTGPTRRTFLGTTAAALASTSLSRAAASDKLVVGIMGCGGRGNDLAPKYASQPNVTVAYVCDPDAKRAGALADKLEKAGKPKPTVVSDLRKMLDDKAVDVMVCAAPNHWHAPSGILACSAGKHCYIEKPCSHTPQEGEWLVAAARKNKRVVQMGNQRRSWPKVQEAIQKLHDGEIGRVYFAQAWYTNNRDTIGVGQAKEPPAGLDYELWQGPSPRTAFKSNMLHYNWHWFWQWGNGELGNNGIHMLDLLRWGLGADKPIKVTSAGGRYRFKDDQQTPDTHVVSYDFPDGKTATWEGFSCNQIPRAKAIDCLFQGEKGSLTIDGSGYTIYDNKGKEVTKATGEGGDIVHIANFLAAVRGDAKANSEIAEGAASTLLCHLGNISYRVARTLHCDPKTGQILNDPDAAKFWTKDYAAGWEPKV
ncbi:Gfo/Idh/MocA family protein [Limnoglobus roseus]|uniref:Putative Rossmann-fold-type glycoside hydrolase n=1 Tax=Limnoglobus roseus TaxID=2598579 RepID=A0A5C1AAH0_9BACT|nr:Gfo/Idh/MocA family oxidoreductase [Limnoglobus roseus]QEL16211.1 putative Rossmann-fold-type glycoside hydrolase [Limnoglobus roseus]